MSAVFDEGIAGWHNRCHNCKCHGCDDGAGIGEPFGNTTGTMAITNVLEVLGIA